MYIEFVAGYILERYYIILLLRSFLQSGRM